MQAIKLYLDRFIKLDQSHQLFKKNLLAVIKQHTGIDLADKDVEFRGAVVYIRSHPIVRGEIYLKRSLILTDLQGCLGAHNRVNKIIWITVLVEYC